MEQQFRFQENTDKLGHKLNHLFVVVDGVLTYVDEWDGFYAGGEIRDEDGRQKALAHAKAWDAKKYDEMMLAIT